MVAIRVAPEIAADRQALSRATILVDTSASRALGFPAYARAVDELVATLAREHAGLAVVVAAFDQGVEPIFTGAAVDAAGTLEPALRGRMPLGASDLAGALAWAKAQGAAGRVIVVTDGVATAGATDVAALGAAVKALGAGVDRLDVVLAGGIRDRDAAIALTRGRLTQDGAVLAFDSGVAEVASRLAQATRSGIKVKVEGARGCGPSGSTGCSPATPR